MVHSISLFHSLPSIFTVRMNESTSLTSSTNAEIEETIARIRSHKGVEGILVITKDGKFIVYATCVMIVFKMCNDYTV